MADPIANATQAVAQAQSAAGAVGSIGIISKAMDAMFSNDKSAQEKLAGIVGAIVGAGVTMDAANISNALAGNISPTQVAAPYPARSQSTGVAV